MASAGAVLKKMVPELVVSKRKLRVAEACCQVRLKREEGNQNLGFSSRPFVLCGLPVKKPAATDLLYERRNGNFVLQITGHPSFGLPWGQDRLILIYLATLAVQQQNQTIRFRSASEMLEAFALHKGGREYRRLVSAFERIFGATIFFGTENMLPKAKVVQRTRLSFFREAQIWYSRDPQQCPIDDQFQNVIVLSDEFYREISSHPIPTDLEAVKALSDSPAVLDLFMWLSYRCFVAKGEESIPLFGPFGLSAQIGSGEYARPRRFRENLEKWLDTVRFLWPKCPARINSDGQTLRISREVAVSSRSALSPGEREAWSGRR